MKTFIVKATCYDQYYEEHHETYHTVCAETVAAAELKAETYLNHINNLLNNRDLSSVTCYVQHEIISHIPD